MQGFLPRLILPLAMGWLALGLSSPTVADDRAETLFVRRIAPLLETKCLACHGNDPARREGDLDLRSLSAMLQGGESGEPVVSPGDPNGSPLYLAVTRTSDVWSAMPPKEVEALSAEQLGWIAEWIRWGAPWPDSERAAQIRATNFPQWLAEERGETVATSGGLSPEWTNRRYSPDALWAYQPVKKPATMNAGAGAIDELVEARMPPGLQAASAADARTFIRRATFDLTGLPPSPERILQFEAAYAAKPDHAVRGLVEELLASPHYGERMARHWLDVVRYADSSGFSNDYERGNAWRYRDYVVRAFNDDKPYDRFVREQIAGDEIDPTNPEAIVATGFLRMGPWELTGMEVAKVARQRFLDDVTNSVGETFLSHSLQCARCHDHKFDPVPTRDYYAIQAVFSTTQLAEWEAAFLPTENVRGFEERRYLEQARAEHLRTLAALDDVLLKNAKRWFLESGKDASAWESAVANHQMRSSTSAHPPIGDTFAAARGALARGGTQESEIPPKYLGFTPQQFGLERVARKGLERLVWQFERYEPYALAVYSGRTPVMSGVYAPVRMPEDKLVAGELERICILTGGDPFASGDPVTPGVLSAIGTLDATSIPESIEGRRKAFAEWVANKDNPLTSRSIANRLWMWHFGKAIAGNPNDFGSAGKRLTHPELLDWLAATLVEEGWSIKSMHRKIMATAVYRRSCEHPDREKLARLDPLASSYAVFMPRRLSAEELRDAMLAVTGELNRDLGGIPVRPEINLEAALQPRQVMGTFAAAWAPNPLPQQRHRRSIYALSLRGLPDPFLQVLNAPSSDFSCERRDTSTVTPQVFTLFNSRASHLRALALAHRALNDTEGLPEATDPVGPDNDPKVLERCFQLALGRSPGADELRMCLSHWREMQPIHSVARPAVERPPSQILREAIEENTGERFSFVEQLYPVRDFVPDLQPAECDPRTRALADVCLALLNSNEFSYVY